VKAVVVIHNGGGLNSKLAICYFVMN